MADEYHLEPNQVPALLKGSYNGRKFKARVVTEMEIPADHGLWSGGSRDTYEAVCLSSGKRIPALGQQAAPWDESRQRGNYKITLKPGFAVVRHTLFCGKDMGLTFFVRPEDTNTLAIEAKAEFDATERLVLIGTASFKSSYNGKDRYQMVADGLRWKQDAPPMPSRDDWNAAVDRLIARKLLRKNKSITPAGRNAIGSERL